MAAPLGPQKQRRPKNRKTKTFLEFDEKARSEYLRGFQKRKNERKKLAREKHDRRVMVERKELLKEARDQKKSHLRQECVVIPEIQHLVDPEIFDLPDHTVTIANIGDVDFVGKTGLRMGQNTRNDASKSEDKSVMNTEDEAASKPVLNKSLKLRLAACSNQLSAQKTQTKKLKKKQMLRQKLKMKKKGTAKGKRKK